jgi:hypothetical protein
MPYDAGDFRWWDLEEPDLAAHLYNILAPIQLGDRNYNNSWDQFQRENPVGAYAWLVGTRYKWLEEAIVVLRPVQKLLANPDLAVRTDRGDINRDEWLRMTVDLFLFRFAGIRDHCLHLVNELYEFILPPLEVRMSKVIKGIPDRDAGVRDALTAISKVAVDHRDERNRHAHEGTQRELAEEPRFKSLAMNEERGDPKSGTARVSSRETGEHTYDVRDRFAKLPAH